MIYVDNQPRARLLQPEIITHPGPTKGAIRTRRWWLEKIDKTVDRHSVEGFGIGERGVDMIAPCGIEP